MFRPYLTILKDSFHEAFASRVLWVLLVVATLVLLLIAPIGLQESRSVELHLDSVSDWPALIAQIKYQSEQDQPSPGKRVWEKSSQVFKDEVESAFGDDETLQFNYPLMSVVFEQLNDLVKDGDLYETSAWEGSGLDEEFVTLAGRSKDLSDEERFYLNRELLRVGFPGAISDTPEKELKVSYLIWSNDIPLSLNDAESVINMVLAFVMKYFLGTGAVFIAILVTAPIVPKMFEAGAIDLLLSKPVSRPLVFLVKFVGGCAFILLVSGYLFAGLWVIMGVRFGVWNSSLLLCIPLLMFLFVIYYSVSALAGMLWKNTIVSVVIAIVFWCACFGVGMAEYWIERLFIKPVTIVELVPTERTLLGVLQTGQVVQWQNGDWELAFTLGNTGGGPGFGHQIVLGAIDDPEKDQLTFMQKSPMGGPFGGFSTGPTLVDVKWNNGKWKVERGPVVPTDASWLLETAGHEQLIVTDEGISRRKGEEERDGVLRSALKALIGGDGPFANVGPAESLDMEESVAAAIDPNTDDVVVYDQKKLTRLVRDNDGKYQSAKHRTLDDATDSALLALVGTNVVLGLSDGRVLVLSSKDLEVNDEYRPAGKSKPVQVTSTRDGKWFAMLFQNGRLLVGDENGKRVDVMGRDISAVAFDGNKTMLVADHAHRVTGYHVGTREIEFRRTTKSGMIQNVYYYFILPFDTVFPKPGDLGQVVDHVMTSDEDVKVGRPKPIGLRFREEEVDIKTPIYNGAAFMLIMLTLSCLYVRRIDI